MQNNQNSPPGVSHVSTCENIKETTKAKKLQVDAPTAIAFEIKCPGKISLMITQVMPPKPGKN